MHIPFLMKKLPFSSLLWRFAIFENYLKDPTDVIKLDLTQPDWKAKVLNKVKEVGTLKGQTENLNFDGWIYTRYVIRISKYWLPYEGTRLADHAMAIHTNKAFVFFLWVSTRWLKVLLYMYMFYRSSKDNATPCNLIRPLSMFALEQVQDELR